jgi:integrase/recombinase XerD
VQVYGKDGKYRTVFINAKAYVTLNDYLQTRNDTDEHLFVSDRKPHKGLSRYAIEHIVSEISDRAYRMTGKRITPHVFRHTTATTALQNGMPVQNISRMLGHSQIETTMIYAEVNNIDVQRDHLRYVI